MSDALPAAMLGIVFFLTIGGVILLRPISKHLGEFLQVLIEEKRGAASMRGDRRLAGEVERMEQRMAHLEERLEFAERLLDSPRPLGSGDVAGPKSTPVEVGPS